MGDANLWKCFKMIELAKARSGWWLELFPTKKPLLAAWYFKINLPVLLGGFVHMAFD